MDQTAPTQPAAWPPRRVALATLVVLGIACAFWVVIQFRLVFFSLFVAIVLSTAIEPLIGRLARIGIPRAVSIILISLLVLGIIAALIITVTPLISDQWFNISSLLTQWYDKLYKLLLESPSLLIRRVAQQMPTYLPLTVPAAPAAQTPGAASGPTAADMLQQAFSIGTIVLQNLILAISVLLLTGLWIIEGETVTRFLLVAVPATQRESAREFLGNVQLKIGAYTRGLALLLLFVGVMSTIAYIIIGLPYALLLGLLAGLLEIVPLVGPLLGAIPAVLVAVSTSPDKIIWVIIAYVIIQMTESHFLVPRVMDRTVGVNPVASLLAFIAFGSIFGFLGAVLAVPLAAVVLLILNRYVFTTSPHEQVPLTGRDMVSTLRYEAQDLVQDVRKQIREKDTELTAREDRIEDAMEAIATDLDSILADVETDNQNGNGHSKSIREVG